MARSRRGARDSLPCARGPDASGCRADRGRDPLTCARRPAARRRRPERQLRRRDAQQPGRFRRPDGTLLGDHQLDGRGTGSVDYIGGHWNAADGLRSVDLDGTGPGSIRSDPITTAVGQSYTVSFQYSANSDGGSTQHALGSCEWGGHHHWSADHALQSPNSSPGMGWTSDQVTVTGTGSDTLSFASLDAASDPLRHRDRAMSRSARRSTVQPTLTTTPTPSPATLGTMLSDSATLTGTASGATAGGISRSTPTSATTPAAIRRSTPNRSRSTATGRTRAGRSSPTGRAPTTGRSPTRVIR